MEQKPKRNRRKETRPAEIIEAATDVFVRYGFAATKLDDVAKQACVAKGTLYLYFNTKEDLFRAVVQQAVSANLQATEQGAEMFNGSLSDFLTVFLLRAAGKMSDSRLPALARLVIGESYAFPDLARIWHDNVLSQTLTILTQVIEKAQANNEIRPGNAAAYAFSILGPIVMAVLFQEVFGSGSAHAPDLGTLAEQHIATILQGMLVVPT